MCSKCHRIMACKAPGGSKKKYIYYKCDSCKTSINENKLTALLVDEISSIMEYDITVKKFFAPLLKHKIENTNELLTKEIISLKDKLIRLKEAYLNNIISIEEYKIDKNNLENKIGQIEEKQKEERELDKYNFTFEDIMLKRDLESIKSMTIPFYQNNFKIKWNELSISEKQNLMMDYIESIEVIKKDNNDLEIKQINFRKTFIEEYANLFNAKAINCYKDISANGNNIQLETCAPMTKDEIKKYIKKLQLYYPIDYQEVEKEKINDNQFQLKYNKSNRFNEPLKIIPIINNNNFKTITKYGVIEIPVHPISVMIPNFNIK